MRTRNLPGTSFISLWEAPEIPWEMTQIITRSILKFHTPKKSSRKKTKKGSAAATWPSTRLHAGHRCRACIMMHKLHNAPGAMQTHNCLCSDVLKAQIAPKSAAEKNSCICITTGAETGAKREPRSWLTRSRGSPPKCPSHTQANLAIQTRPRPILPAPCRYFGDRCGGSSRTARQTGRDLS